MIGNRTAEKDIRDYLSQNGYFGNSARFSELEIYAIQRPGWLQVFRFCVEAKTLDEREVLLFGVMKDDERFKINEIKLFENRNRRDAQLSIWSKGLVMAKYSPAEAADFSRGRYVREFVVLLAIVIAIFGLLAILGIK